MKCQDYHYYRAYIERLMAPGYSTCKKCDRPWKFVDGHNTSYSDSSGCLPLCESCWQDLKTPEARMPYYRKLWLEWEAWGSNVEWKVIERAVLSEGPSELVENVECLGCGWQGLETDLDPDCDDGGYPYIKSDGCPSCHSLGWEYITQCQVNPAKNQVAQT